MKKCIFGKSQNHGAKIFYFRYNEPEEGNYDYDYVWVYANDNRENLVMGCHVSQIIILDDDVKLDPCVGGCCQYLSSWAFGKVYDEFSSK